MFLRGRAGLFQIFSVPTDEHLVEEGPRARHPEERGPLRRFMAQTRQNCKRCRTSRQSGVIIVSRRVARWPDAQLSQMPRCRWSLQRLSKRERAWTPPCSGLFPSSSSPGPSCILLPGKLRNVGTVLQQACPCRAKWRPTYVVGRGSERSSSTFWMDGLTVSTAGLPFYSWKSSSRAKNMGKGSIEQA